MYVHERRTKMTVNFIQNRVYDANNGFAKTYRNAAPFVNSGELWDYCMAIATDERHMICIAFANELGIPPVKSLLHFYRQEKNPSADFNFDSKPSQWLGSFMGFIFKYCLNYQSQKERIQVNMYGIGTATKYLSPPTGFKII